MHNEITILKWLFYVEVMEQRWAGRYYPQIVSWGLLFGKISHKIQGKEKAGRAEKMLMFRVWTRGERNGPNLNLPCSGEHQKPKN